MENNGEDVKQVSGLEWKDKLAAISEEDENKLLDAIKEQRWYFFKNKPSVLMDRDTGLLWANLEYFPWCKEWNRDSQYSFNNVKDGTEEILQAYSCDGYSGWKMPSVAEFRQMVQDKNFPFQDGKGYRIKDKADWLCRQGECGIAIDLNEKAFPVSNNNGFWSSCGYLLPNNDILVANTNYKGNVAPSNRAYSERERYRFTLELFLEKDLQPVFENDEITQLYMRIYNGEGMQPVLPPVQTLQVPMELQQEEVALSVEFDYEAMLGKYDIAAIDKSPIKYYQAVQRWTDELVDKLDAYEKQKEGVFRNFNEMNLRLLKQYRKNANLTEEENLLLEERQKCFQKELSFGMSQVKSKILAVKKQADDLENRIDEIDNGEDAIYALAVLEQEQRASFSLIAENTAKIINNALSKLAYFEEHNLFVEHSIDIWERWSEAYRVFKSAYKNNLKNLCEEDGIEEELWSRWYQDWQQLRFAIEQKVWPMLKRGLKGEIAVAEADETTVVEKVINVLKGYRDSIDKFYLEERKSIYQKYAFESEGNLLDKMETEKRLYSYTAEFQSALQGIIFNCKRAEDRIFILNWANSLLDIQIDEILDFAKDNDLDKIAETILDEFIALKQKNYDIYLADAKTYNKEKTRREKEYNSLLYKMSKKLTE